MAAAPPAPLPNPKHHFRPALHHPIVHAAQHLISPLTGSLLIFAVHKAWQAPTALATLRGAALLKASGELSPLAAARWSLRALAAGGAAAVCGSFLWRSASSSSLPVPPLPARLGALYPPEEAPLAARALSQWPTSEVVTAGLRAARDATGAPWWATIVGATLALRVSLVPANLLLLRNSLRMKLLLPELHRLGAALADGGASVPARTAAARQLRTLLHAKGASPWAQTLFFPLLMPPAILTFFHSIHDLTLSEPSMAREGALWFPDLVACDKSQLLPILSNLSFLWQVEMGAGAHYASYASLRLAVRVTAVATVPLVANLPSGVFVFWVTSNAFAIARGYAARLPAVRRALGIPLQGEIAALSFLPKG